MMATSKTVGGQTTFVSLGQRYVHYRGLDGVDIFVRQTEENSSVSNSEINIGRRIVAQSNGLVGVVMDRGENK